MNRSRRQAVALLLVSVPLAAALGACASSSDSGNSARSSSSTAGGVAAPDPGAPPVSEPTDAAARSPQAADGRASTASVIDRAVIATGSLRLTTRHLAALRQDAIDLVTGRGGQVADEQSQSDPRGVLDWVDLTLRVPAAGFDQAMDDLARLGTLRHREQSVKDVTTQVIDTDARVRAQEDSVASFQRLLGRASSIAEIMSVESQLASRQADLDSLKAQQKWLADQTSMSTVQLTLTRSSGPGTVARAGFLGGLGHGWHALGRSTVAVGTALGAVLPFAVVIVLIGGPAWALFRRRGTPGAPQEPAVQS